MQDCIGDTLKKNHKELRNLAAFIHSHPETGHREFLACACYKKLLTELGFPVTQLTGKLATAFMAEYGKEKPVVAFCAEYDALADLGHGCGHNLLGTAAAAAFLGTAAAIKAGQCSGKVILFGTPAEEGKGGKIDMLKEGFFDSVDYALGCHPYSKTGIDKQDLAVSRFDVFFYGKAAHAANAPELGVNALDAMNLLFSGIGLYRQQMPRGGKLHGIIISGGESANIIPAKTSAFFYVRGETDAIRDEVEKRLRAMVRGAAMMTGCSSRILPQENPYSAGTPNPEIAKLLERCMEQRGMPIEEFPNWNASSDFADVEKKIPAASVFFNILEPGEEMALHTRGFACAAARDSAFEKALKTGAAMADAAVTLLKRPRRSASQRK